MSRLVRIVSVVMMTAVMLTAVTLPAWSQARRQQQLPQDYNGLVNAYESAKGARGFERARIIRGFAKCKDPRTVDFLIKIYQSEKDRYALRALFDTISNFKEKKTADFLVKAYTETNGDVKAAVVKAMAAMADLVPFKYLKEAALADDYEVKAEAVASLGTLQTKKAVEVLCEVYARDKFAETGKRRPKKLSGNAARHHSTYKGNLQKAFQGIENAETLEWIASEALGSDKKIFRAAFEVLIPLAARKGVKKALPNLLKILESGDPPARTAAAAAIGDLGGSAHSAALLKAAKNDAASFVKAAAALALGKIGGEGVVGTMLKLSGDKSWEVRAAAIRVLGDHVTEKSTKAAVKALTDKAWQVRLAAVEALGKHRSIDSVEPLIKAMQKNPGRIARDIADVLHEMLEADFGLDHKEWANWWKRVKDGFVIKEKKPVETGKDLAEKPKQKFRTYSEKNPRFFGSEITSTRVIFIIDISGSMSSGLTRNPGGGRPAVGDRKVDLAKKELVNAIKGLHKKGWFNVYFFETNYSSWKKSMVRSTRGNKVTAIKWVQGMQPTGSTNLYDPLEEALQDPNVDTIYLLSDGAPCAGKWTRHEDILREVKKKNEHRNVKINTIAFGQDSKLLKDLAAQNKGEYIYKQK